MYITLASVAIIVTAGVASGAFSRDAYEEYNETSHPIPDRAKEFEALARRHIPPAAY
jgi:hypothetical protein